MESKFKNYYFKMYQMNSLSKKKIKIILVFKLRKLEESIANIMKSNRFIYTKTK
jgi:hypothetical protein